MSVCSGGRKNFHTEHTDPAEQQVLKMRIVFRRRRLAAVFLLGVLLVSACSEDGRVVVPDADAQTILAGAVNVPKVYRDKLEGVYTVTDGNVIFGPQVVLKWTGTTLSLFWERSAGVAFFATGLRDSSLLCAGSWRTLTNTETGVVTLQCGPADGIGAVLRSDSLTDGSLVLQGTFSTPDGPQKRPLRLVYKRPLYAGPRPFHIIAHRAGGRNSDRLPASENTVELVRLAEFYGSTGVEIDVQLTADGVPVIYHDEYLNLRLNQRSGLVGTVGSYTFAQLETFVRLINGERIPSLRRMLSTILHETNLKFVWLDSKPSMPISTLRIAQRLYHDSAAALGRDLRILIGLPDEDKVNEFLALTDYRQAPALCELDPDDVRRTNAAVWAPRWTLGTQNAEVEALQAEGRRAFVWTLDVSGYIRQFVRDGRFDGILTNYPSLVAYHYYAQ